MKTFQEINDKIRKGTAVVLTAEEMIQLVEEKGAKEAAKEVDVVTTATFGPMCSSGVFLNFGQSDPPIKMKKVWLNGVPAYGGLASVDAFLGATERKEDTDELYGGANVIESLVKGESVELRAQGGVTYCKPREEYHGKVDKNSLNECILFNPRNAYQNYAAATNSTDEQCYTYMGKLEPQFGNVTYSTSGEFSPLMKDPELRTIGVGTRIFLGGSVGYVAWNGTQFNPEREKNEKGIPIGPARTLSVIGNLKSMTDEYIKAIAIKNYGTSLYVGIGIPIPVLDEEMAKQLAVRNRDIHTYLYDYGVQRREKPVVRAVNYEELRSGEIDINGTQVKTYPISSLSKAKKIMNTLKQWIQRGEFLLQEPVQPFQTTSDFKVLKDAEDV